MSTILIRFFKKKMTHLILRKIARKSHGNWPRWWCNYILILFLDRLDCFAVRGELRTGGIVRSTTYLLQTTDVTLNRGWGTLCITPWKTSGGPYVTCQQLPRTGAVTSRGSEREAHALWQTSVWFWCLWSWAPHTSQVEVVSGFLGHRIFILLVYFVIYPVLNRLKDKKHYCEDEEELLRIDVLKR